jgi:hypothetical protein
MASAPKPIAEAMRVSRRRLREGFRRPRIGLAIVPLAH